MRVLKFRAWDLIEKCFIEPEGLAVRLVDGELCCDYVDSLYVNERSRNAEDFVLMQFTGLRDADGRDVYEGDIVATLNDTLTVEWNDDTCAFQFSDGQPINSGSTYGQWLSIIGNIYEKDKLSKS